MDKELVMRPYLVRGGQWLNIRMKTSDKWCPSGVSTDSGAL